MPKMSKKCKLEWQFFLNQRNRITYNPLCRKCIHGCKQSFRAVVMNCPRYLSKRAKGKLMIHYKPFVLWIEGFETKGVI
jgi:hypothetical protein